MIDIVLKLILLIKLLKLLGANLLSSTLNFCEIVYSCLILNSKYIFGLLDSSLIKGLLKSKRD